MKKLILAFVAVALLAPAASAQVRVEGYTKKDGTYVAPHYRSNPNSTAIDNWSTKGNVNPYTAKKGTKQPESSWGSSQAKKVPCYYSCPE
jgi:opacity protein-like surface antigen